MKEGQICSFVALKTYGIFREYSYYNGIGKTIDFVFGNSFFSAYSSFVNRTISDVYIEALISSEALLMDYKTKQKLFKPVPEWEKLVRHIIEKHYLEKEKRVTILANLSAKEKYDNLLKNENPEIIRNIPLQYIASYLGITLETLSRIRKNIC